VQCTGWLLLLSTHLPWCQLSSVQQRGNVRQLHLDPTFTQGHEAVAVCVCVCGWMGVSTVQVMGGCMCMQHTATHPAAATGAAAKAVAVAVATGAATGAAAVAATAATGAAAMAVATGAAAVATGARGGGGDICICC
jgi:hypothetical protein